MAINPGTEFTGKIDNTDLLNYPYGKARNITTPGDGTGSPWVASIVNDIFGFQQALLDISGVVPSGTPETIQLSQYLDAMQKLNGVQIFTAAGTFNTPSWVRRIKVTITGGGGSGAVSGINGAASGGGGGATVVQYIDDPDPSYAVVIGPGGAGVTSPGDEGLSGTDTTFGALTARRGSAGQNGRQFGGGSGGSPSGGDLRYYGGRGGMAASDVSVEDGRGGEGGFSTWGRGGNGGGYEDSAGSAVNYGGGGGAYYGADNGTSGAGFAGICVVEWGLGIGVV